MIRYFIFLILIARVTSTVALQNFAVHEDSLKTMMQKIIEPRHDFERLALNFEFRQYFEQVLLMDGSFDYPFDSLTITSRLRAPDNSFRIISWYVPLGNGAFEYFGFFQSEQSRGGSYHLYPLVDKSAEIEKPQYETLDHENWYGTYYTELIHNRYKRKDYYILLGWRADNPLTRKRIIEPLRIMGKGRPSFGKPVFKYKDNRQRRIIFEYSAKVSMSIRYETQVIEPGKRPREIILFDRMGPTHSSFKGQYHFYVPETNVFDGFIFDSGHWVFISDIDARNPRRRPTPRPVPPPVDP